MRGALGDSYVRARQMRVRADVRCVSAKGAGICKRLNARHHPCWTPAHALAAAAWAARLLTALAMYGTHSAGGSRPLKTFASASSSR